MPAVPLTFRSVCGHFATVYASFMLKRARFSLAMRISILRLRTRADGVTVGMLLTLLYYGNLIHRCGDVELNPGPDRKTDGTRQTLLDSVTGGTTQRHSSRSRKDSLRKDSVESTGSTPETLTGLPSDPSLSDVMSMLTNICQCDNMDANIKDMKKTCDAMQGDMSDLKKDFIDLKLENQTLKRENDRLTEKGIGFLSGGLFL
ncbi:hypothetical protein ACOMHN_037222 [Nucella lapillus]